MPGERPWINGDGADGCDQDDLIRVAIAGCP
jgi:hypothetical protein